MSVKKPKPRYRLRARGSWHGGWSNEQDFGPDLKFVRQAANNQEREAQAEGETYNATVLDLKTNEVVYWIPQQENEDVKSR